MGDVVFKGKPTDHNLNLEGDARALAVTQGISWLLENELLDNQPVQQALVLNIYKVSNHIISTEILIDSNQKKMLIWLELSRFGVLFKRRKISSSVLDMLQSVLPNFQFRVIFDRILFEKAVRNSKRAIAFKPSSSGKPPKAATDEGSKS